jgi:hypothetical protein
MLHAEDVRTVSKTIGLNPTARPAATTWQATVTRDITISAGEPPATTPGRRF